MKYSATLRKAAPTLAQHPNGYDILRILASWERTADDPQTAEWDTAEAMHYVGSHFHRGQWDPVYVMQCTGFRPGPSWRRPEPCSVAAIIASELIPLVR